jgi:hypothetical protein
MKKKEESSTAVADKQSVAQADVGSVESVLGGDVASTDVDADADFLSEDLSTTDTSFPVVKEGPAELLIAKVEKLPNKKGNGFNLKFTLKAMGELVTTKDEVVQAGFPFTTLIPITPSENYTEDMIKRKVALFVQAMKGTLLFPLAQWEGQVAQCRITIRKERTDKETGDVYPMQNEIKFVKE